MDDVLTVHGGITGTRALVGIYAAMVLRRRGIKPRPLPGRRAWALGEAKEAMTLRAAGWTDTQIGEWLRRSSGSVKFKFRSMAA